MKTHRILFGPARSYSTSVWNFFKQLPNEFHTTDLKEFDTGILTKEKYLKNYTTEKIYIDCSLLYYRSDQNKDMLNNIKFDKNSCIYNVRNLKHTIRSLFLLVLAKKDSHCMSFSELMNYYDLSNLYKYDFDIIMIQNFNINVIMDYLKIDIPKLDFLRYNSNFDIYGNKSTYIKSFKMFEKLFTENIEEFRNLVDNNVEFIKQQTMIGDFNEHEYRRE